MDFPLHKCMVSVHCAVEQFARFATSCLQGVLPPCPGKTTTIFATLKERKVKILKRNCANTLVRNVKYK